MVVFILAVACLTVLVRCTADVVADIIAKIIKAVI